MYENLPLFWYNIKFWTFMGLIRPRNTAKMFMFLFIPFIVNIMQYIHLFEVIGKLEEFVLSFFQISFLTMTLVRVLNISKNEKKFIAILALIDHWYEMAARKEQDFNLEILSIIAKRGQKTARYNFYGTVCAVLPLFLIPIFTKGKQHAWQISIPGVDVHASPMYEIICCIEMIVFLPFLMFIFSPYSAFCTIILMVMTGLLECLRLQLENLQNKNNVKLFEELRKCIKFHNDIMKFRDMFEELISIVSMIELVYYGGGLCVLMCFFLAAKTIFSQYVAATLMFLLMFSVFGKQLHANQLTEKSLSIADAAYSVDWVSDDKRVRTCILIMITRSQKPLQITAGGIYPQTLHTFQRLLNASYSYFTLLQGTIKRK